MSDSLRDQLLKAGLVTKKQAAQVERQQVQRQHQQSKGQKPAPVHGRGPGSGPPQAQAAKVARDQALNRERQARAEAKARHAEIKQLIEQNRLPKVESDEYFNFVFGRKIGRIPVDAELRGRLMSGTLAIVRCEGRYDVVPLDAAARISERDARYVVALDSRRTDATPAEDDPYKDYVVPDDLMW